MGRLYLRQERFTEAEPTFRECLATIAKRSPDHWQMHRMQSLIGSCLLGQKKYDEAEPLLHQAYDGLEARRSQEDERPASYDWTR